MNAQEIIERIRTAEKKTPVKVYLTEKAPIDFPNATVFPCGETKLIFGDWKDIQPVLDANKDNIAQLVIENDSRNSAIPLLDKKNINARIEPGAILREQVEIGDNAVIMMGAVINIGAVIGAGSMIDMGAVLGGRAIVGKNCHIGAGTVLAGGVEPASAVPVIIEEAVPEAGEETYPAGAIVATRKKLFVACPDGLLRVVRIRPGGKKSMDAVSYINGLRLSLSGPAVIGEALPPQGAAG